MSATGTSYDRLNLLRLPDETNAAFAHRLGLTLGTLRGWKKRRKVPLRYMTVLRERTGINPFWLYTGKGQPFPDVLLPGKQAFSGYAVAPAFELASATLFGSPPEEKTDIISVASIYLLGFVHGKRGVMKVEQLP